MSEKEPETGGPDPLPEPAPRTPSGPRAQRSREIEEPDSLATVGVMLVWKAVRRWAGALLRQPIPESAVVAVERDESPGDEPIHSERSEDRNLTLEYEKNLFRRRRWGTFLAGLSFAAAICSGVGFLFIYWTGGSNESLGGCLAGFFGGLAVGLVIHAHLLAVHKEATEQREPLPSPPEECEATAEEFRSSLLELQRRGMLKWMAGIGLGTLAVMIVSLLNSALPDPFVGLYTEVWKRGQRLLKSDGTPIKADDLTPGSTTIVFPQGSVGSERAQTVLIRVDPQLLQLPGERADWAPLGNLAYSRVCTHAGCPVGLYEKTAHLLMCPCHQSTFAVLNGAQPTGGPAARPLPQLPLYVDADGYLRAGGGFSNPPGPGFWGMPS